MAYSDKTLNPALLMKLVLISSTTSTRYLRRYAHASYIYGHNIVNKHTTRARGCWTLKVLCRRSLNWIPREHPGPGREWYIYSGGGLWCCIRPVVKTRLGNRGLWSLSGSGGGGGENEKGDRKGLMGPRALTKTTWHMRFI